MALAITHNGPFHADDVLAWALLRRFVDGALALERTRDAARFAAADFVFDVGGVFDAANGRFDHHQASYTGRRSSAGMVLDWLADAGHAPPDVADALRKHLVDYVDDVDNGRRAPVTGVPCFPQLVDGLNAGCSSLVEFDAAFLRAGELASAWVAGIVATAAEERRAAAVVRAAMDAAAAAGRRFLDLPEFVKWKPAYFAAGGADHPTEFVLFPGTDATWRIVAIPPVEGDFGQKRSLPEAWAGLSGEALVAVCGIPGAVFCHKNRFIAVFTTREGALAALEQALG